MFGGEKPKALVHKAIRNSTVIGATSTELAGNMQKASQILAELGETITLDVTDSISANIAINSRTSTYRIDGCLVQNQASTIGALEHSITICGKPQDVQTVEQKLALRIPELWAHTPSDPEERKTWIQEIVWKFPEGIDLREFTSIPDVAVDSLDQGLRERGIFLGKSKERQ